MLLGISLTTLEIINSNHAYSVGHTLWQKLMIIIYLQNMFVVQAPGENSRRKNIQSIFHFGIYLNFHVSKALLVWLKKF
jgi:hypothetical protein